MKHPCDFSASDTLPKNKKGPVNRQEYSAEQAKILNALRSKKQNLTLTPTNKALSSWLSCSQLPARSSPLKNASPRSAFWPCLYRSASDWKMSLWSRSPRNFPDWVSPPLREVRSS